MFADPYSTTLLSSDGILLGAAIAQDEQWRFPPVEKIPEKYREALILFEDKRFYSHRGIDFIAIVRAFYLNVKYGEIRSGGSTISMQTIRLSRKWQSRTISEKIIECISAFRMEMVLNKEDILALYASHAPFGGNVIGIDAASWRYFGRKADNLSWAESSLLAVLPNSPGLIHPGRNRDDLLKKRNDLLEKMYLNKVISKQDLLLSKAEPLPDNPFPLPKLSPHVLENSKKQFKTDNKIVTTLDGVVQRNLNYVLNQHKSRLINQGIENAAVLVLKVDDGTVLGYMGNLPGENIKHKYVDHIRANRSTGSLLKPFLYAAMVDSGELLPTQLVLDIPTRIGSYKPENHTKEYLGAVHADEVITHSLNVPIARMLRDFGVDRFYSLLKDLGMTTLHRSPEDYGIALILGGAEGSLWELTNIYGNIARVLSFKDGPFYKSPQILKDIIPEYLYTSENVAGISAGSWWTMAQAMMNLKRPDEDGAWESFSNSQKIAWKTGTSYGYRDAWAIGFNSGYVVGVWVGNSTGEGRPGLQGSKAAGPILFDVFNLLPESRDFSIPPHMVLEAICQETGYLAGPYCEKISYQYLSDSSNQGKVCPYHIVVHLDEKEEFLVNSKIYPVNKIVNRNWFVLPNLAAWYYQKHHGDYIPLPPTHRLLVDEYSNSYSQSFSIIFPENGSSIYIPRDYDGKEEKIIFEAVTRDSNKQLFWHLDGKYLANTIDKHQIEVYAEAGNHELVVVDSTGFRQLRLFSIISK